MDSKYSDFFRRKPAWLSRNGKMHSFVISSCYLRLLLLAIIILTFGFILSDTLGTIIAPSTSAASFTPSQYAGHSMQSLAAIGGFAGCVLAADCATKGSSSDQSRKSVAFEYKNTMFAIREIAIIFTYLMLTGLFGALCFCIAVPTEIPEMAAALFIVYAPTVLFAICFGTSLSLIFHSKTTSVALYGAWWIISILWSLGLLSGISHSPEIFATLNITGESLGLAYFEQLSEPHTSINASFDLSSVKDAAGRNLAFLLEVIAVLIFACWVILYYRRQTGGLSNSRDKTPSVRPTLNFFPAALQTMGIARIALPIILATAPLLPFAAASLHSNPSLIPVISVCSVLPIIQATSLLELKKMNVSIKAECFSKMTRRHLGVRLKKILFMLLISTSSLFVVSGFWAASGTVDFVSLLIKGTIPSLLFPTLAFLIISIGREGETMSLVVLFGTWAALHLPPFFETLSSAGLSGLHPLGCVLYPGLTLSLIGYAMWLGLVGAAIYSVYRRDEIEARLD